MGSHNFMYRLIYVTGYVYILIYYAVDSRENGGVKEAAYYDYAGVGPCDFNNATSNYEELDAVSYIEYYIS